MASYVVHDSPVSAWLFANTKSSWIWLIIRLYVGYEWLMAGWGKVTSDMWTGSQAGSVITKFAMGSLAKTVGDHPDVPAWYAWFLNHLVIPYPQVWSFLVAYGELLVGIALIIGFLTGIAAFFGVFMNANYLFAGTVSVNPELLLLGILLMLAWKVAGHWGVDYYLLPKLGAPWSPGRMLSK